MTAPRPRRQTFELPGVGHGSTPIPTAAMVGGFLHSSAIPAIDPATGSLPSSATDQVAQVFVNASALLTLAGLSADDVVHIEVLLADDALRGAVNEQWLSWYPEADDRPARHTTVQPLPGGMAVQLVIEAVAP